MGYTPKDVGYTPKDVGYTPKDVGYTPKDVGYTKCDILCLCSTRLFPTVVVGFCVDLGL